MCGKIMPRADLAFFELARLCLRFTFRPKVLGNREWLDAQIIPPADLVPGLVKLLVVVSAKRHGELVADLQAQSPGLRKPQMMRVGRQLAADEARLRRDIPQMVLVTMSLGFANCQNTLVDFPWQEIG